MHPDLYSPSNSHQLYTLISPSRMLLDLGYNNTVMFTACSKISLGPQLESKTHVAQTVRDKL